MAATVRKGGGEPPGKLQRWLKYSDYKFSATGKRLMTALTKVLAKGKPIASQEEANVEALAYRQVKDLAREIEDYYGAITKPVRAELVGIDTGKRVLLAPVLATLDRVEARLKVWKRTVDLAHQRKVAEEQAAAIAAAQETRKTQVAALEAVAAIESDEGVKTALAHEAASLAAAPMIVERTDPTPPPAFSGLAGRKVYVPEVFDLLALVTAIAEGKAPLDAVQANAAFLRTWAQQTQGTATLPGVKVVQDESLAARRVR